MVVIIDINCLLASIPPQSNHYWLYHSFKEKYFDWLISNEIMAEYEKKLAIRFSQQTANLVLAILTAVPNVVFDEPYFK